MPTSAKVMTSAKFWWHHFVGVMSEIIPTKFHIIWISCSKFINWIKCPFSVLRSPKKPSRNRVNRMEQSKFLLSTSAPDFMNIKSNTFYNNVSARSSSIHFAFEELRWVSRVQGCFKERSVFFFLKNSK